MVVQMSMPGAKILLVDDEEAIQKLLRFPLEKEGYQVVQARDGQEALDAFGREPFDLVILDLMLPRVDGTEVCRRLRAQSTVPIIMLTAKSDEFDKVLGLEIGADDYITKDRFSLREFRSRVRAQLRRAEMSRQSDGSRQEVVRIDELEVDLLKRNVDVRGKRVDLTYIEFELLKTLVSHPGRVYSRQILLQLVWGDSEFRDARTVDVHIRHLREKIELDPKNPEFIFTVRNIGYKFREF
jgi:two-component system, OmpR family, response regulator